MQIPFDQPLTSPAPERPHTGALIILLGIGILTLLAPILAPYGPLALSGEPPYMQPSAAHLLGTDSLGRDVLSRTLWGGRQTLSTALLGSVIAILPGLVIGSIAGFSGGWPDRLLMAGMDILLAFPNLLLALALITLLGSGSGQVALAVGLAGLPAFARLIRTTVLETRNAPYIDAAQAIGASSLRVMIYHVLPNIRSAISSYAVVSFSWVLLNGAALAFLGFSGDPGQPDWGVMLNEGRAAFRVAPWIAIPPGLAITLTVYAANRLADLWHDRSR
jgi:peptide/nickel transport system permease protein